jgi:hypothetical protein
MRQTIPAYPRASLAASTVGVHKAMGGRVAEAERQTELR